MWIRGTFADALNGHDLQCVSIAVKKSTPLKHCFEKCLPTTILKRKMSVGGSHPINRGSESEGECFVDAVDDGCS